MISSSQLSMSRSELRKRSRWLTIATIAICAAVVGLFCLSMAFHMPGLGLLMNTFKLSSATANKIVDYIASGLLWLVVILWPFLYPYYNTLYNLFNYYGRAKTVAW